MKKINYSCLSIVGFVILWETIVDFGWIQKVNIGVPHEIVGIIWQQLTDPSYYARLENSAIPFLIGFIIAVFVAIVMGLVLGSNERFRQLLSPYVYIMNALPFVAIIPLLVIWFGIGMLAKGMIVFMMVVPPMTINAMDSFRTVDIDLIEMAQSFGASRWQQYREIYLPHALPYLFSGARVGVGRGITAIVVSEVFGIGIGVAYYLSYYSAMLKTDTLMADVFIIIAINFTLLFAIKSIQKRVVFWQ